jgi:hypothetical protein
MEQLDLNHILNRSEEEKIIKTFLTCFNEKCLTTKKAIYIYGESGVGKTMFAKNILLTLDYDVIIYDSGSIRNSGFIEEILNNNVSNKNIMSILNKKTKKIAIIMDEIDGMNKGDKGGMNALIKCIRPKKTKKQQNENITNIPIICIGDLFTDKKNKELMKFCHTIELKKPTNIQCNIIIQHLFPDISPDICHAIMNYIQGDLTKINNIYKIHKKNPYILTLDLFKNTFHTKFYNEDTKKIIHKLLHKNHHIEEHNYIINENDRTSIALLWHENIIDYLPKATLTSGLPKTTLTSGLPKATLTSGLPKVTYNATQVDFYITQLSNICYADYIDRITFQKQIWQFNEMTSLLKTFKNHKLYHESIPPNEIPVTNDIRFTKVLTKYSTEYNNSLFIQKLCQKLGIDKKDLFAVFIYLKYKQLYDINKMIELFEIYDIPKLEIQRIYRYLDKYMIENAFGVKEIDEIDEIIEPEFEEM